jgi:hypothetical protein
LIPLDKADRSRQSSIWVDGEEYLIHTAFHYWIGFGKRLEDGKDFPLSELDYLYKIITVDGKEYGIPDRQKGFDELCKFYINKQPLPRETDGKRKNTVDLEIDSERIYCAFLERYNINLITTDLHWHDFQALFYNLFYPLDYVIGARLYEKPVKKTQKQIEAAEEALNLQKRYMWELETKKKEQFKMR